MERIQETKPQQKLGTEWETPMLADTEESRDSLRVFFFYCSSSYIYTDIYIYLYMYIYTHTHTFHLFVVLKRKSEAPIGVIWARPSH